jgi:TIR domain
MRPPKIFLNYRREDSEAAAGRLYDRLVPEFGGDNVFLDVDSMPPGSVFPTHLRAKVTGCDTFLAIVGPKWLEIADDKGHRRLDDPNDFVRIEIATAFYRDIPVIPILLDGAKIPRSDQLPPDLQNLADRNAFVIQQATFRADAGRLIGELKTILPAPAPNTLGRFALGTFLGAFAGVLFTKSSSDLIRQVYTNESTTGDFILGLAFVLLGILGFMTTIRIWTPMRIFGASTISAFFAASICIGAAIPTAKWVPPDLRWLGLLEYFIVQALFLIVWWRLTSRTGLGWPSKPRTGGTPFSGTARDL